MNYITMNEHDIANGTGFRVSLFVSGCRNHCKGCFSMKSWDFRSGMPFDEDAKDALMAALDRPETEGITLLGGEPLEPENQPAILALLKEIRKELPEKTVWLYTGRTLHIDERRLYLSSNDMKYDIATTGILPEILSLCDIVVDGPFIEEMKSTTMFRGSSNQRIIDMKETLKTRHIVLWHPPATEVTVV